MLPQLSQLFHQHKKAFVSLSHFFYFIFIFLLQTASATLYSLQCGDKFVAF